MIKKTILLDISNETNVLRSDQKIAAAFGTVINCGHGMTGILDYVLRGPRPDRGLIVALDKIEDLEMIAAIDWPALPQEGRRHPRDVVMLWMGNADALRLGRQGREDRIVPAIAFNELTDWLARRDGKGFVTIDAVHKEASHLCSMPGYRRRIHLANTTVYGAIAGSPSLQTA